MEMKTAVIDRIEKGIATVSPDDGSEIFTLSVTKELFEGQTVVITDDGIRPACSGEGPFRNNKERLEKLFNKNK